jgi:hypothetical protein
MYSLSGVQDNGNELTELERQRNKTELQGTVGLGFGRRRMYSLNTISKPEEPGYSGLPGKRDGTRMKLAQTGTEAKSREREDSGTLYGRPSQKAF